MDDTKAQTESLLDIVKGIDNGSVMLPEFQRDFRWELEQTFDLFDSIVKDIFIGTIIYGKPSFGMSLREIDRRPRRGKGSTIKLNIKSLTTEQIKQESQTKHLRIVLDGQQRITSLYRALTGKGDDRVFLVLKDFFSFEEVKLQTLEKMTQSFQGTPSPSAVSILLSDAYRAEVEMLEQEELDALFDATPYGRLLQLNDPTKLKESRRVYRWGISKLRDMYKQQKLVAYYLLDMGLDKFCLFFERSNSRGILLNFTDILAAKLYRGFNLRKKIEEYESKNHPLTLNREVVIRAIAYIRGSNLLLSEKGDKKISIDKKDILDRLEFSDFNEHWDNVCAWYNDAIKYLSGQHFILSQSWIPSENMILPLMMFRRRIKGFDQMTEAQRRFVEFWYWASIFSNRYSGASNEVIIEDSAVLEQVARGEKIPNRYCERMRSRIENADDLFSYNKRTSTIYRGVLNLLGYEQRGLRSWNNGDILKADVPLEGHHIYPRAYIEQAPSNSLDTSQTEAEELLDCVVNMTLIPKLTNIKIGKRPPSQYLSELRNSNPKLEECLASHMVNPALIDNKDWDRQFKHFLDERGNGIVTLIQKYVTHAAESVAKLHEASRETAAAHS